MFYDKITSDIRDYLETFKYLDLSSSAIKRVRIESDSNFVEPEHVGQRWKRAPHDEYGSL